MITSENIKYQYKPSFTIEPIIFKKFVDYLLPVFDCIDKECENMMKSIIDEVRSKHQANPTQYPLKNSETMECEALLRHIERKRNYVKTLSTNALVGLFGRRKNTYIPKPSKCDPNEPDDIASQWEQYKKPFINEINDRLCIITSEEELKN